jgi:hypothetical protein
MKAHQALPGAIVYGFAVLIRFGMGVYDAAEGPKGMGSGNR